MESPDVSILYCEDAVEWKDCLINSLKTNFSDKRIDSHRLEDLVLPLTLAKQGAFLRIKAQVVIISPDLLGYMQDNPEVILGRLFDPTRVLAFVCGVEESDFQTMHRANLLTFDVWKKVGVTEEGEDCVLDILRWTSEVLMVEDEAESSKLSKAGFKLHPSKVRESANKVIIETLEKVPEGQTLNITVETDTESIPLKAVLRNPYMAKFVLPNRFFDVSQIVYITVKCGVKSLGSQPLKCESKMAEMDSLLRTSLNPLSFMCQTLGLAESQIEELDHILTNLVKTNIPKCGFSVLDLSKHVDKQKVDVELPTLLHFSAKMGLKELSAVLLDCPGGEAACRLRNVHGHTPADLAENQGHSCLAGLLESFSSMSETAEIYIYMQRMSEDVNNKNYANLNTTFRRSVEHGFQCSNFARLSIDDPCPEGAVGGEILPSNSYTNTEFHEQLAIKAQQESSSKGTNLHLYGQSQQELLQLIEDFKEEKYDIEQVEVLFRSWQQRQHSRSFYEKQKQIQELRNQYEQLQKQCHEKTKKKSALERFRCVLLRNVKKEENVNPPAKPKAVYKRENPSESEDMLADLRMKQRPSSTWSCGSNSSSLSDRSSTMSGTSDSGTLSDIGEEKHVYHRKTDDDPKKAQKSVSMAFENKQYMFSSSRPLPPLPSKKVLEPSAPKHIPPKSASSKLGSPKFGMPLPGLSTLKANIAPQLSISNRKPMPPPRIPETLSQTSQCMPSLIITPTSDNSEENLKERHPTAAVPFSQISNHRKRSLTSQASALPECGSSSEDYLLMNSQRPVPGRRPSAPNYQTPICAEPDYYNKLPNEPIGDYMDMASASNAEIPPGNVGNPQEMLPGNRNDHLAPYANVICVQGNMSTVDDGRCDSVPEMMAPPPPAIPATNVKQKPPPLPPRNFEK